MPTVKDFMDNNDNVRKKIDLTPDMDNIGICNENLYDGMLHDIPEHLQNLKVVQEGWLIGAGCNCLTVIEEKKFTFEIKESRSRLVTVSATTEEEAMKTVEEKYFNGDIVLNSEDMKGYGILRYYEKNKKIMKEYMTLKDKGCL